MKQDKILTLRLTKIHCVDCAKRIEKRLTELDGVKDANTIIKSRRVHVALDRQPASSGEIIKTLKEAGFSARVEVLDSQVGIREHGEQDNIFRLLRRQIEKVQLGTGVVITVLLGALTILHQFLLADIVQQFMFFFALIVAVWVAFPLYQKAFFSPTRLDFLTLVAGVALFFLSAANTFFLGGPEYYFLFSIIMTSLLGERFLEMELWKRVHAFENRLKSFRAKKAKLLMDDGTSRYVRMRDVKVGDHVHVKSQERIPFDGVVVAGNCTVDESFLSGESTLKERVGGDKILAGSLNHAGTIIMEVQARGSDMVLNQFITAIRKSRKVYSHIQVLLNRMSWAIVPIIVLVSAGTFFGWFFAGLSFDDSVLLTATVFIAASPYTLRLVTPLAYAMSVQKFATRGILIQSTENIEKLPRIDKAIFGFSGIVTKGQPEVTEVIGGDRFKTIQMAASLAQNFEHPLSHAVVARSRKDGVNLSRNIKELSSAAGRGVRGTIDGRVLLLGSPLFMEESGIDLAPVQQTISELEKLGRIIIVLASKREAIAVLGVSEEAQPGIKKALQHIRNLELKSILISGHHEPSLRFWKKEMDIDRVIAEPSPRGREKIVEGLNKQRNLALALKPSNQPDLFKNADVGIMLSNEKEFDFTTRDIIFLRGELRKIVELFALSAYASRIIKQNVVWAFVYNVVIVILVFVGIVGPYVATIASFLSPTVLLLNSLRLKNDPKTK